MAMIGQGWLFIMGEWGIVEMDFCEKIRKDVGDEWKR